MKQDAYLDQAQQFYKMAVTKNFVQGRRTEHVVAACLYIVCRLRKTAHMLIDFSEVLQVNMYVIGLVFLKLSKLLSMLKFPVIDPSLYIHRFASKLDFGNKEAAVARSALQLVQSMKRDWMQTGRRPTGICGAALYIAAKIHNFDRSVTNIISVVRVGETTLKKRLTEFELTQASMLTIEQFNQTAESWDDPAMIAPGVEEDPSDMVKCANCEVLKPRFDKGFCRPCYEDWVRASGGTFAEAADPIAYQRNRRKDALMAISNKALGAIPVAAIEAAKAQMVKLLQDPAFLSLEVLPAEKVPKRKQKASILPKLMAIEAAPDIGNIIETHAPLDVTDKFQKADPSMIRVHIIGTVVASEVSGPKPDAAAPVSRSEVLDDDDDDEEVLNSMLTSEEAEAKTKVWLEMNADYLVQKEERDRLIREGVIKQRPNRKKKEEAATAQEALDGVLSKKKMAATAKGLKLDGKRSKEGAGEEETEAEMLRLASGGAQKRRKF